MEFNYSVKGGDFTSAGAASSSVKKNLKLLNLNPKILKRVAVALYEAEVNVVAHAFFGEIKVSITDLEIVIVIDDVGPGIESIDDAMKEGYSTASSKVREMGFGAGMGLPNIKNNADDMQISSIVGKGTTLILNFKIR